MDREPKARVAVVTGGTGGLGRSVVKLLLEEGLRVHVPWRSEAEARELAALVRAPRPDLTLAEADVTDPASVQSWFASVGAKEGRLDVLCNLVGGFSAGGIAETEPEGWERMVRLNATSAFLCCRAAVPLLAESGGGRIVNVTALPALERGGPGMSAYAASKAALLSLTHSLSRELREQGITVNAVAPEILDTAANRRAMPEADTSGWLRAEDVARVIAFLAGPHGRVVTGSVLALARV